MSKILVVDDESRIREIIKKYNSNYLLTAHHGDDLVETILMKLTK